MSHKGKSKDYWDHGRYAWKKGICKCDICKRASNDYDKNWKDNPIVKDKRKLYQKNNTDDYRECHWKKQGIDNNFKWKDYLKMFTEQDGKCKICGKDFYLQSEVRGKTACVDHNHSTGKVRALLCNRCNFLVGQLESELANKAKEYIEEYK